jgi:hypothetical protein
LDAFVPSGYVIERKLEVDLNGDGLRDAALLIVPECKDEADLGFPRDADCLSEGRMLVIVFRLAAGGYNLSVSKPISSGIGVHGDHFYGIEVRGRTLLVKGGAFSTTGSEGSDQTLQFRYQADDWFLIGRVETRWGPTAYDSTNQVICPELSLRKGETCSALKRSINFSTSMEESIWSVQSGTEGVDEKTRTIVARKKLSPTALTRLADVALDF